MSSPWPHSPRRLYEGTSRCVERVSHADPFPHFPCPVKQLTETNRAIDNTNTLNAPNIAPSRLARSQSINDQLSKTPRVSPNWGHSLSRSYGGTDWPLPASSESTSAVSTPLSLPQPQPPHDMYAVALSNETPWTDQAGAKKRGPKPKNEPAATVTLLFDGAD
jgi:hypothetical protein